MNKKKKIRIGVITGVIVAAIAGTLLGIYLPPLFKKVKIEDLVKKQVIPAEGKGNFVSYELKNQIETAPYDKKMQSLEDYTIEALKSESGYKKVLDNFISNYIIDFWKGFKDSEATKEKYNNWIKDIDKAWDEKIKSYKKNYGKNWEYYFQLEVLDPVGGNEDDWKRKELIGKINGDFDSYIFDGSYINALDKNGNVISNFSNLTPALQKYLISPELINGTGGDGTRNKIVFKPTPAEVSNDPAKQAKANFQEFVFNEWIKEELPIITTMTLWKHTNPDTSIKGYKFFNKTLADEIYNGNGPTTFAQTREGEETPPPEEGGDTGSSSSVGISEGYKWQAYPAKSNALDSPSGTTTMNSTDKYLNFANQLGANSDGFFLPGTKTINIGTDYADDGSTIYYIQLGAGSESVVTTSYTQYATAAIYKFNQVLGLPNAIDSNVPKTTKLSTAPVVPNTSGTEVMSNFVSTQPKAGFFNLPKQVQDILNDGIEGTVPFKGLYNGVKAIADVVDIENTPFILSRNESGVHVIGIDRFENIKNANGYQGKINEIANTVLWRHIATKSGINSTEYLNDGSSLDVYEKIKTYFTNNRNELLYKYIKANETTNNASENYIFSSKYTTMDQDHLISKSKLTKYIDAKIDLEDYKKNIPHNKNVKDKIIELQTTKFSLTYKTFGNSVIQNGLGGMLPFTRTTTPNNAPDAQGYYDETYGMYDSLQIYGPDQNKTQWNQKYTNLGLKAKEDAFKQSVTDLYNELKTLNLGLKKLTFSSAKYNQYLLLGCENDTSTRYYASDVQLVSEALNEWISANGNSIKAIIETQRMLSDVNGIKPDKQDGNTKASKKETVLDIANIALDGTYTDPTTMVQAPAIPSTNADSKAFVNYQLQKAYQNTKTLGGAKTKLKDYQDGKGLTIEQLSNFGRIDWITPLLKDRYAGPLLDYIKDVIGMKEAFDFNDKTGEYEFTKFKNYLVDQTSNNKKAAFVWVTNEKKGFIEGYEKAAIKDHFAHKNLIYGEGYTDINGYMYQGASERSTYVNEQTKQFKNIGTFNNTSNYDNVIPVLHNNPNLNYAGFQGMVFESSSPADLPSEAKTNLFSNKELYVFDNKDGAAIPDNAQPVSKGSLYNTGGRTELANQVQNNIFDWGAINNTVSWLHSSFGEAVVQPDPATGFTGIPSSVLNELQSLTTLPAAKTRIKEIINNPKYVPEYVFELNQAALLSSGAPNIFPGRKKDLRYFGDAQQLIGSTISQVVFTQFNHNDVVNLFDTNNDKKLDDNDKGINWAFASANGFLNSSAEAFFYTVIDWYSTQSTYKTSAVKAADDREGKFDVYDRRLNDLFGKALVKNYKDSI